MSYTRGMGSTATDVAAVAAAASTAAAQIIAAATGTSAGSAIDPATGMPVGSVNPMTGRPYGAINPLTGQTYDAEATAMYATPETSYVPYIVGALVLVGVVGFLATRRRPTPNRRRSGRRRSKR